MPAMRARMPAMRARMPTMAVRACLLCLRARALFPSFQPLGLANQLKICSNELRDARQIAMSSAAAPMWLQAKNTKLGCGFFALCYQTD